MSFFPSTKNPQFTVGIDQWDVTNAKKYKNKQDKTVIDEDKNDEAQDESNNVMKKLLLNDQVQSKSKFSQFKTPKVDMAVKIERGLNTNHFEADREDIIFPNNYEIKKTKKEFLLDTGGDIEQEIVEAKNYFRQRTLLRAQQIEKLKKARDLKRKLKKEQRENEDPLLSNEANPWKETLRILSSCENIVKVKTFNIQQAAQKIEKNCNKKIQRSKITTDDTDFF